MAFTLPPVELSPVQVRVLGCLVEKERTTPGSYPLTMNALLAACNQTTSRDPVLTLSEAAVEAAVENLRSANLLRVDYSRSNRAAKYHHLVSRAWALDPPETALLAVLMLRGPQTVAELRSRTERLHDFGGQAGVTAALDRLAARPEPLVACLGRGSGQKEARWAHLLSGTPHFDEALPQAKPRSGPPRTTIEPWLSVADATAAVDHYKAAFGAVELLRHEDDAANVAVAHLSVGGAGFWVQHNDHASAESYSAHSRVRMILTVVDPDSAFACAIAQGATVVAPMEEGYGWRIGRLVDPFGHHWEIGRPLSSG